MKQLFAGLIAGAALLVGPAPVHAGDPPPPTIEALLEKVIEARKSKIDADKLESQAILMLREAIDRLNKRLAELGVPIVPPKPPAPPAPPKPPEPKPPTPTDPLAVALQTAYRADAAPNKAEQIAILAELYKQAADLTGDASVSTTGELVERVKAAAKALKLDGLPALRALLATEVAKVYPEDVTLTDSNRKAGRELFTRIHEALKGASK